MDRVRVGGPGLRRLGDAFDPLAQLGLTGPGAGGLASSGGLSGPGGVLSSGELSGPGGILGSTGLSGSLLGMSLGSPATVGRLTGMVDLGQPLTWPGREATRAAAKQAATGTTTTGGASASPTSLPEGDLPGVSANVLRWKGLAQQYADQYGVPVEAVLAIIHNESGGNERATSANNPDVGPARGLMQTLQLHYGAGQDPYDPATNINAGTRYFASIYHTYGNRLDSAMAGYFGGEGVLNPDGSVRTPGAADVYGTTIGGYVPKFLRTVAAYRQAIGQPSATPVGTVPTRASVAGWTGGVAYPVTGGFGARGGPYPGGGHIGLDLGVPNGTTITAPVGGTVVHAGGDYNQGGYGNAVVLRLDDGNTVILGHLSAALVQAGARVGAGTRLGVSGATGTATGPHLHLEVRDSSGRQIDPQTYFSG